MVNINKVPRGNGNVRPLDIRMKFTRAHLAQHPDQTGSAVFPVKFLLTHIPTYKTELNSDSPVTVFNLKSKSYSPRLSLSSSQ